MNKWVKKHIWTECWLHNIQQTRGPAKFYNFHSQVDVAIGPGGKKQEILNI